MKNWNKKLYVVIVIASTISLLIFIFAQKTPLEAALTQGDEKGTVTGTLIFQPGLPVPENLNVGLFNPDEDDLPDPVPYPRFAENPDGSKDFSFSIDEGYRRALDPPIYITEVDVQTGEFTFPAVLASQYILKLIPPDDSSLMTTSTEFLEVTQINNDLGEIAVVEAQLTGYVTEPMDEDRAEGFVSLLIDDGTYYQTVRSVNGRYFMTDIPAGKYTIRAFAPPRQSKYFDSDVIELEIEGDENSETVDIMFSPPEIFGRVLDPIGNPVRHAFVGAYTEHELSYPFYPAIVIEADGNGFWQMGGLEDGDYNLRVYTDYFEHDSDVIQPYPRSITFPFDQDPVQLQYRRLSEENKFLIGRVLDNAGLHASGGEVTAYN